MKRVFDILPPIAPQKQSSASSPKRKNSSPTFFLLFLFLVIGFLLAAALQNPSKINLGDRLSKTPSQSEPGIKNNFELFNEEGGSSLNPKSQPIKVRLLNASSEDANLEKTKKILLDAGFKIEQSRKAENLYEQTLVYYKKGEEDKGQKTEAALKDFYEVKLDMSENLSQDYDVLVIVGKK